MIKEEFPSEMSVVHFTVFIILILIITPIFFFTNKLDEHKILLIAVFVFLILFLMVTNGLVIHKLYKWNKKKQNLLEKFGDQISVIKNQKVKFRSDGSFTNIHETFFGDSFTPTLIDFTYCDLFQIKDSLMIFGRGANNNGFGSKGVYEPFEINLSNEYITNFNKAVVVNLDSTENDTIFKLEVSNIWKGFSFELRIQDFILLKK